VLIKNFKEGLKVSKYLLYGDQMIKNDGTMKDFAKSVCDGVPTDGLDKKDLENFKDEFIDLVCEILKNDISRTDINYEDLMCKYRSELGGLLYEIENHGGNMPLIKFFGEEAEDSFNYLIKEYIDIHFNELINV
jgi:hypothetical protein